jgi:hypothetical protein
MRGFNKAVWSGRAVDDGDDVGLVLGTCSPDGDEGISGYARCR